LEKITKLVWLRNAKSQEITAQWNGTTRELRLPWLWYRNALTWWEMKNCLGNFNCNFHFQVHLTQILLTAHYPTFYHTLLDML
jgi:hypothetical protein